MNQPRTSHTPQPVADNEHLAANISPEQFFSSNELQALNDVSNPLVISQDLSLYSIQTPFMILLETCREQDGLWAAAELLWQGERLTVTARLEE